MIRCSVWAICLALAAPLAAAPLWQEDFATGPTGWAVVGDPGAAQVAADAGKTGAGLRLGGPAEGALVSPAQAGTTQDWLVLTLQVRHVSGAGGLTLGMVSGEGEVTAAPIPAWRSDLPTDGKWHRVELTLAPPPGDKWRLVLGTEPEGVWTVDDLALVAAPATRTPQDPWLKGLDKAEGLEALPANWSPEGTLDARMRKIGDTIELTLNVGGLALSIPSEAQALRGERHPILIYVDNRGQVDKQLTVAAQAASPGAYMPTYTVPIKSGGTTALLARFQVLRVGDCWVKFTFTVGKESAAAPLRVHVKDGYPVLAQEALPLSASSVPAYLPFAGMLLATPPALPDPSQALRLPLPASDPVVALQEQLQDQRPALLQLAAPQEGPAPTPEQVVAAYQGLTEKVLPNLPFTALVSPPWSVTPGEHGLQPDAAMEAAFDSGLANWVKSVSVGLRELPTCGVVAERVDGRQRPLANAFWQRFGRRYDFAPLRQFLVEQGPAHPLLLDLSQLSASAAPRLEMLLLARLLLEQSWQGSTGILLDSGARVLQAAEGQSAVVYEGVQQLWRELAGAVPMAVPTAEDGLCGNAPDSPVRCWAFLRKAEGILFLANNTSAPQEVLAEIRAEPFQMQVLRLRAEGPAVTREIQNVFRFTEEAQTRHQPAVYLRLAPGEIVGVSLHIAGEDWTWLRSVGKLVPREQALPGPPPASGGQLWYERGRS